MDVVGEFFADGRIVIDEADFYGTFPCAFLREEELPWLGRFTSAYAWELADVGIVGVFDTCGPGTLTGALGSSPARLVIARASLPSGSLGTCYVSGELEIDPSTIGVSP